MSTWAEFKRELKNSEGVISHMYLDTKGKVTVGVGNMLPTFVEAQRIAFINRKTLLGASKAEIKLDFENVAKQPKGLPANHYAPFTALDLPPNEIDSLLDKRIKEFKSQLTSHFPKFDYYPITAQFALLDMAFNLGTNGLITKFPKFNEAVAAEDWEAAARESYRPDVSVDRNNTVRNWLISASIAANPMRATRAALVTKHLTFAGIPSKDFPNHLAGWDLRHPVYEKTLEPGEHIISYNRNASSYGIGATGNYFALAGATMSGVGIDSGLSGRNAVEFEVQRNVSVLEGTAAFINGPPAGGISGIGGATQIFIADKGLSSLTALGAAS